MAHSEKFEFYTDYMSINPSNVGRSRQSEFGHLSRILISAILVIEIFCIIQFWPA